MAVFRLPSHPLEPLSPREREILELIAQGYSNAGICAMHHLSDKTVEAHVRSIFRKLDIRTCRHAHRRVTAVLIYLDAVTDDRLAA